MKYKCGHKTNGVIIMDDNEMSMMVYLDWVHSKGFKGSSEQCFDCFIKEKT